MKRTLRQNHQEPSSQSRHNTFASNVAFHPAEDFSQRDSPPRSFPAGVTVDLNDSDTNYNSVEELERERRYRAYVGNTGHNNNYGGDDYEVEDENAHRRGGEGLALPLYHQKGGNDMQSQEQLDMRLGGGLGAEMSRRRVGGLPAIPASPNDPNVSYLDGEKDALLMENERSTSPAYDEQGKMFGSKGFGMGPRTGGRRGIPLMTSRRPENVPQWIMQNEEIFFTALYTALSLFTRLWKIGAADYVVWDEAHFGKFGSHYINRDFYFDVHPPLGKMLVGLVGVLSGYGGGFDFKSGAPYGDKVPYTTMRVLMAMFGVGMVPVAWWTAGELGWSRQSRHLVTLCVLFDVGWLCISRFILLDSMLLFFTFTTILGLVKFHNQRHDAFGDDWWAWLVFTGLQIGCVCSVKWVGLFGATALVGLYTVEDLWNKFGDLRMPKMTYIRHWLARGLCLIFIPFCVYAMSFKLHFMILNRSGPGDAQMSSLFQAHLRGNDFAQSPLEIAYGSKLTLKNYGYGGGLLHSHVQTYPVGSLQQQVTCYHYKDDNNNFYIYPPWGGKPVDPDAELEYVRDGDVLRIVHVPTTRNIHSHTVPAPMTKENYEVSAYGNLTVGDVHDHWVVEVVDDMILGKKKNVDKIHALTTRMRFRHQVLGCYLKAANVPLPQWGWKQIEVTCDKQNNPADAHTWWNVESHWNDRLPSGDAKLYKSPFWKDFWHLNVAMMTSNNALIPDPDKDDILASQPLDWPWLHLGLRMCGWGDNQIKYYLLGTPIIWWGGGVALIVGCLTLVTYLMRMQRQYKDWAEGEWDDWLYVFKLALGGWLTHFVPFLIMGRVTYLHHYLPTLWFAVLMIGHMLDTFVFRSSKRSNRAKWIWFGVLAGSVFFCFMWFRGMAFGITGPIKDHRGLKWRKTWNIYDDRD